MTFFYLTNEKKTFDIPLKDLKYSINISDNAYEYTSTQEYVNDNDFPIETYYKYPVYATASLINVKIIIDDKEIECVIKEKEEAYKEYDDAIAEGNQAVLVSEDTEEMYDIKVGNIKPHQTIMINQTYLCELKDNKIIIPTTFAPRYDSWFDPTETSNGAINTSNNLTYEISKIDIHTNEISQVSCISHNSQLSNSNGIYTIEHLEPNKDVIFSVKMNNISFVHYDGDILHISTTFDFKKENMYDNDPCEFIFVIDYSGSMIGINMLMVTILTKEIIHMLPINGKHYINLYQFGSQYVKMFGNSKPLTSQYSNITYKYMDDHKTDNLGGTEMYSVLYDIHSTQKPKDVKKRKIILITDGDIGNIDTVISLTKSDSDTKIFTVGIGNEVSHHLVEKLAQVSYGESFFISANDAENTQNNICYTAQSIIDAIQVGDHTFICCDAETKQVIVKYNSHHTQLDRFFVYHEDIKNMTIIVKNNQGFCLGEITIPITRNIGRITPMERFYYKQQINVLENITYYKEQTEENKKKLIELSIKYSILTRFTSFIGVVKSKDPTNDTMKFIEIPLHTAYMCNNNSTGALVVNGGIGVSKNLFVGNNISFDVIPNQIKVQNRHLINITKPIGVNSIGASLKNPSYDLRSSPIYPKFVVSPWIQSNIEPNNTIKSISVGGSLVQEGFVTNNRLVAQSFYDPTYTLPPNPSIGDYYVCLITANSWIVNYIYEWNGTTWCEIIPKKSMLIYVKDVTNLPQDYSIGNMFIYQNNKWQPYVHSI